MCRHQVLTCSHLHTTHPQQCLCQHACVCVVCTGRPPATLGLVLTHGAGGDLGTGLLPRYAQAAASLAGIPVARFTCKPVHLATRVTAMKVQWGTAGGVPGAKHWLTCWYLLLSSQCPTVVLSAPQHCLRNSAPRITFFTPCCTAVAGACRRSWRQHHSWTLPSRASAAGWWAGTAW
jgi:hypothetical protein